jgi:hypothetical protein
MYLGAPKAMAQDYNLVGTGVVENPHKILPMLVGYHYSLLRSSCTDTKPQGGLNN